MRKYRIFIAVLIAAAVAVAFAPTYLALTIALALAATILLVRNLEFGLLVLVFFFPYLGLVVDFGQFEIFRQNAYLKNINAPFVDLFGLVLFLAWILRLVISTIAKRSGEISSASHRQGVRSLAAIEMTVRGAFPHWRPYFFFWLSSLVSLFKVPSIYFGTALKYFARPFTFAYLVFFAAPVSIMVHVISRRGAAGDKPPPYSTTHLHKILTVFFWTGLLSAFNGLLGLLFGAHETFMRATPFEFFGINPLGPNHNLLAETLIATAPAGLILSQLKTYNLHTYTLTTWIRYGMFFQWAIALLTFARSAWIAVAVQAVVYWWLTYKNHPSPTPPQSSPRAGEENPFKRRGKQLVLVIVILAVLAGILLGTIFSETVRGSTLSRLDQARIAAFYFERSPLIGQGIGTFVPTLWQTKAFLLEYGDPLEAHGILFKLAFEQGLFGILAFGIFAGAILFGIYSIYRTSKTNRAYIIAAFMIAVGSLTYQLFNTTYYTAKLWVPLAIAIGIARIYSRGSLSGLVADKSRSVHHPL